MKSFVLILILLCQLNLSWAEEHVVEIPGIKFAATKLKIKEGDTIKFKNTSTVNHMVNTFDPSLMWNLGDQKPGEVVAAPTLPKLVKGKKYEIQCGYHENMKLTVEVK